MPDTITLTTAMQKTVAQPGGLESPGSAPGPLLSVIVPVRNEGENIRGLIGEIAAALHDVAHEIVYVDDGSTDDTAARLAEVAAGPLGRALVCLRHRVSCGQSAAVLSGVRAAVGFWIATLDGDGQNDPADIPRLLARVRAEAPEAEGCGAGKTGDEGPVLIAGHRTTRHDSLVKRVGSRIANAVRAGLLRDHTPDTGCGLKLFRREAFLALPHFDHMHRFLPALFIRAGGRVISVPVSHRPRLHGRSKYGTLDRLWVGLFDLVGVYWLQRRWQRPVVERVNQRLPSYRGL